MTNRERPPTFGYLHIASPGEAGRGSGGVGPWVAGYLIVCPMGRPLEFHCTAPVTASPAQAILYGKSLRSFVFGEHLGSALVGKARLAPDVLLVDDADAEAAGRAGTLATVLLPTDDGSHPPIAAAPLDGLPVEAWLLSRGAAGGAEQAADLLRQLAASVELAEPFDRIREAVAEAQRGTDSAQDDPQSGAPYLDAA